MGGFRVCLNARVKTKLAPQCSVLMHWQYKSFTVLDKLVDDVITAFFEQLGHSTRIK